MVSYSCPELMEATGPGLCVPSGTSHSMWAAPTEEAYPLGTEASLCLGHRDKELSVELPAAGLLAVGKECLSPGAGISVLQPQSPEHPQKSRLPGSVAEKGLPS